MRSAGAATGMRWRVIVVGGHTRNIGKTQLVCDVIRAFPKTQWIAGKITQHGHGLGGGQGEDYDSAPGEDVCMLDWETRTDTGTDSARFLVAGAKRSFWLRTKEGHLAEGLALLRGAMREATLDGAEEGSQAVIVESNSLLQFVKPSLYFAVIDPLREDFKESAQLVLEQANALVLRAETPAEGSPAPLWMRLPAKLLQEKPSVLQREGESLPKPLEALVHQILEEAPGVEL